MVEHLWIKIIVIMFIQREQISNNFCKMGEQMWNMDKNSLLRVVSLEDYNKKMGVSWLVDRHDFRKYCNLNLEAKKSSWSNNKVSLIVNIIKYLITILIAIIIIL